MVIDIILLVFSLVWLGAYVFGRWVASRPYNAVLYDEGVAWGYFDPWKERE